MGSASTPILAKYAGARDLGDFATTHGLLLGLVGRVLEGSEPERRSALSTLRAIRSYEHGRRVRAARANGEGGSE